MTAPQLHWLGSEWPTDVLAEALASLQGVSAGACQRRASATEINAAGHVDLDTLSERTCANHFYARAVVGRELSVPTVQLAQRN
jgi:hypothetical protein